MKIILLCFVYIFLSNNIIANECQYSKWGRDDQKGNANLITDESVLNASPNIVGPVFGGNAVPERLSERTQGGNAMINIFEVFNESASYKDIKMCWI